METLLRTSNRFGKDGLLCVLLRNTNMRLFSQFVSNRYTPVYLKLVA